MMPLETLTLKEKKTRHGERLAEIEKLKKKREQKAIEKAKREDDMALLARLRARAQFQDKENIGDESYFDQRKLTRSNSPKLLHCEKTEKEEEEDNLQKKAMKVMGGMEEDGDEVFGDDDEVNIDSQDYSWNDKYRPRKPKYLNRVYSWYEWNKYNRTHYDHDNPPPKVVQGYKFNVFYPDLVDKTKAPTYNIDKDGDKVETCIIRFQAGPPYEDVAFRILNKEWECSQKRGFKCTFEGDILRLYFNFQRHCYRR